MHAIHFALARNNNIWLRRENETELILSTSVPQMRAYWLQSTKIFKKKKPHTHTNTILRLPKQFEFFLSIFEIDRVCMGSRSSKSPICKYICFRIFIERRKKGNSFAQIDTIFGKTREDRRKKMYRIDVDAHHWTLNATKTTNDGIFKSIHSNRWLSVMAVILCYGRDFFFSSMFSVESEQWLRQRRA